MLNLHLQKVVKDEDQVIGSLKPSLNDTEIVNIHFAQKNFENYELLEKIDNIGREG